MGMIRGSGGGGSDKPRTPIDMPDSLRSIAYARVLDLVSEGEIYGFADQSNPLSCIYLNETPVANSDGTLNFKNLQIDSRVGTQTQDYIKGFDGTENEIATGVELRHDTPWTRTVSNLNLSAVRVRLSVPSLRRADPTNGDRLGYSISYAIELSTAGGSFVTLMTTSMTGKTTTKYERTHRIDLPPSASGWTIRVVRLTPNRDSEEYSDTMVVESFAEIIDAKLRMPMSALVSMVIDAEQFNNIPTRAFHLKGRIIRVPTNYDPVTRMYDGVWDGTFQARYSNNPAWVFYDMATNTRYGLGDRVPEALIDKWALYKIGVYCDGLVDDGNHGLEPRFTANLYLQTQSDAVRVMQDLATIFRGIMYVAGGSITAVGDMPEDPTYPYTPANVIDGKFVYAGSSRKVRHTVALVSWNDMTDFGRAKVEYVEDLEGIARYGVQPTEVIATGCTSRGQALRLGKYILTTERYETDTVVFGVGLDGTFPAPGKIITISDPLRAGRRTGGRIRTATIDSIAVDNLPLLEIGHTVTVVLPNGKSQTRTVASIVGNTIGVSVPFTAIPVPQSVWMIESSELVAQRFRVLGVSEATDRLGYTINAVQHVEGKFDYVENGVQIVDPPITSMTLPAAPVITMTSFLRYGHGVAFTVISAEWADIPGATEYDIQWRKDDGGWSETKRVSTSDDEWDGAFAGTYIARVWGVTTGGIPGPAALSQPITVTDAVMPIKDLLPVGGVLTIDCRFSQFRLALNQNITSVIFTNVAPQDTLLLEITQTGPGGYTINFGPSVVPVTGITYVPTPTVGAGADMVGLSTNNKGTSWTLVAQQPLVPGEEGGTALAVSIAPSPASNSVNSDGVTPVAPSVQVTVNETGGAAPLTRMWSRADTTGGADFLIDNNAIASPTLTIPAGTASYNKTQTWRVNTTDAGNVSKQALVDITLARVDTSVVPGVSLSPSPAYALVFTQYGVPKTANVVVTASRVGLVGPFTQSWARVSGDAAINCYFSANNNNASFEYSSDRNNIREAVWRHTTIDQGNGNAVYTKDVTVNLEVTDDR